MIVTLMMFAKVATSGHLRIKAFWNKGSDVIKSVYDVTKFFFAWVKSYHRYDYMIKVWSYHFYETGIITWIL